jgi:hypothetical protein
MSNRFWSAVSVVLLAMAGGVVVAAEQDASATPDRRVAEALRAGGLEFEVDSGDFRLSYKLDDTRSQRVWVASGTTKVDRLEMRDVWSVAARGPGEVPADLARLLLKENVRMVLGAWQVNQGESEYLVVFSAPVEAAADPATLQEVIEVVMFSADRIEKQLSPTDAF